MTRWTIGAEVDLPSTSSAGGAGGVKKKSTAAKGQASTTAHLGRSAHVWATSGDYAADGEHDTAETGGQWTADESASPRGTRRDSPLAQTRTATTAATTSRGTEFETEFETETETGSEEYTTDGDEGETDNDDDGDESEGVQADGEASPTESRARSDEEGRLEGRR